MSYEARSPWISLKDRKPHRSGQFFIMTDKRACCAHYNKQLASWLCLHESESGQNCEPLYYMMIPDLPKNTPEERALAIRNKTAHKSKTTHS